MIQTVYHHLSGSLRVHMHTCITRKHKLTRLFSPFTLMIYTPPTQVQPIRCQIVLNLDKSVVTWQTTWLPLRSNCISCSSSLAGTEICRLQCDFHKQPCAQRQNLIKDVCTQEEDLLQKQQTVSPFFISTINPFPFFLCLCHTALPGLICSLNQLPLPPSSLPYNLQMFSRL